jgi:hypothetical protein
VGAQGLELIINGQNFGPAPSARLDGLNLQILEFSNTRIRARIPAGTVLDENDDGRVTLRVTDNTTGQFDTFRGFEIVEGSGVAPDVISVDPNQGTSAVFPVTVRGTNFEDPEVFFEGTRMPIQGTPTSTAIVVRFPNGGLPQTGPLDVTVRNQISGLSDTLPDGFTYVNSPGGGGGGPGSGFGPGGGLPGCFIATAAHGTPFEEELGALRGFRDDVLLKSAVGVAAVDLYYSVSPYLADDVARSPLLAGVVRAGLKPVVWAIQMPWLVLVAPATLMVYGPARRRVRLYFYRLRGKEREC